MIDHLTLRVADLEKGKAFFLAALKPLGYVAVMDFPGMAGFAAGSRHHLEAVIHTPE